jgi:pimeloyl-ACP methyl ester carboxylesterase
VAAIPLRNDAGDITSYVSEVSIIPAGCDTSLSPDVFIGGIHLPAGTYLEGAANGFAIPSNRRLVIYDSIGVGGSITPLDRSVTYEMMTEKLLEIITRRNGNIHYLMGHSLGTAPVGYAIYEYKTGGKRIADLYIALTPIPGVLEEMAGITIDGRFTLGGALQMSLTGGEFPPIPKGYADQHHTKTSAEYLQSIAGNSVLPTNLLRFAELRFNIDKRSILPFIGDPRILYVQNRSDHLFSCNNPSEWEGDGSVFIGDENFLADHSCYAGNDTQQIDCWRRVRELADERAAKPSKSSQEESLNPDKMARRFKPRMGIDVKTEVPFDNRNLNIFGGVRTELGWGLMNNADISIVLQTLAGGMKGFQLPIRLGSEFRLIPSPASMLGRLSFVAGARTGIDVRTSDIEPAYAYTGLKFDAFGMADMALRAGAEIPITGDDNRGFGYTGEFSLTVFFPK